MDVPEYYSCLPYDLAGSRSKNRFRLELLWGISKMLDLMVTDKEDFIVIFDYVCDVEILYNEKLEFYQIKTHKPTTSPYTWEALTKKASAKAQGSILGKLFALNKTNSKEIKLAIVSNISIKINGQLVDFGEFSFSSFSNEEQEKIKNALKNELNTNIVDLSNLFYIYTSLNLQTPENEIKGKIIASFSKIKQCEPNNPNALYRLIFDTVEGRACYEYSEKDFKEISKKKGITRSEFNRILDIHAENEKTGIKQARDYIENQCEISKKRKLNMALTELLRQFSSSHILHVLEKKVSMYLLTSDCGTINQALIQLHQEFDNQFPIEYDEEMKVLFYVIVIGRFEQGAYENENDF